MTNKRILGKVMNFNSDKLFLKFKGVTITPVAVRVLNYQNV